MVLRVPVSDSNTLNVKVSMNDVMTSVDPKELLETIKEMRAGLQEEVRNDPDFADDAEFILVLLSLIEEETVGVTDFKTVDLRKQVKLMAYMPLLSACMDECDGEGEFDEDEEEDDELNSLFFDEEDLEELEEDEEEEI